MENENIKYVCWFYEKRILLKHLVIRYSKPRSKRFAFYLIFCLNNTTYLHWIVYDMYNTYNMEILKISDAKVFTRVLNNCC